MIEDDSLPSRPWTRRELLLGAGTLALASTSAVASAPPGFDAWRESFRAKAAAKGASNATYTRVMGRIEPDMSVFAQMGNQPEFKEELWQYINRRVSDWRIRAGKEALRQHGALFTRIEHDFGVERGTLLALWGVESAFGDPLVQKNHMKPVFPSLAALAWREPRRRRDWETELINALRIVERGWSTPEEMRGSRHASAASEGNTGFMWFFWTNGSPKALSTPQSARSVPRSTPKSCSMRVNSAPCWRSASLPARMRQSETRRLMYCQSSSLNSGWLPICANTLMSGSIRPMTRV